jgi:hypothetical protein
MYCERMWNLRKKEAEERAVFKGVDSAGSSF